MKKYLKLLSLLLLITKHILWNILWLSLQVKHSNPTVSSQTDEQRKQVATQETQGKQSPGTGSVSGKITSRPVYTDLLGRLKNSNVAQHSQL